MLHHPPAVHIQETLLPVERPQLGKLEFLVLPGKATPGCLLCCCQVVVEEDPMVPEDHRQGLAASEELVLRLLVVLLTSPRYRHHVYHQNGITSYWSPARSDAIPHPSRAKSSAAPPSSASKLSTAAIVPDAMLANHMKTLLPVTRHARAALCSRLQVTSVQRCQILPVCALIATVPLARSS